jgi:hypothetical protein
MKPSFIKEMLGSKGQLTDFPDRFATICVRCVSDDKALQYSP